MKKIISWLLVVLMFVSSTGFGSSVNAANEVGNAEEYVFSTINYENGEYLHSEDVVAVVAEDPYLNMYTVNNGKITGECSNHYYYFESDNSNVVMVGNSFDLYTISPGEATIKAKSKIDNKEIASCKVRVIPNPLDPQAKIEDFANAKPTKYLITSVGTYTRGTWIFDEAFNYEKGTTEMLYLGTVVKYSKVLSPRFLEYCSNVTWESSNPKVVAVDQNGKINSIGVGFTIISAKDAASGEELARQMVNVEYDHDAPKQVSIIDVYGGEFIECDDYREKRKRIPLSKTEIELHLYNIQSTRLDEISISIDENIAKIGKIRDVGGGEVNIELIPLKSGTTQIDVSYPDCMTVGTFWIEVSEEMQTSEVSEEMQASEVSEEVSASEVSVSKKMQISQVMKVIKKVFVAVVKAVTKCFRK